MGCGCHWNRRLGSVNRSMTWISSARSRSKSPGGVPPPVPCSISGRVWTPFGQGAGKRSAIHFTNVRKRRLVAGLADFSPIGTWKESVKWQSIWGAFILPQRPGLSGRSVRMRSRIRCRTAASPKCFKDPRCAKPPRRLCASVPGWCAGLPRAVHELAG